MEGTWSIIKSGSTIMIIAQYLGVCVYVTVNNFYDKYYLVFSNFDRAHSYDRKVTALTGKALIKAT